ncbi:hypothetical protein [Nocardia sp. NPDC002869]
MQSLADPVPINTADEGMGRLHRYLGPAKTAVATDTAVGADTRRRVE